MMIFLVLISTIPAKTKESETIRYFRSYHSDNPYSFSYETPFTNEIHEPYNKNLKYYYKVLYRNNKIIQSEHFRDGKIARVVFFNSKGRQKTVIRGERSTDIEYGQNEKILIEKIQGIIQRKIINKYQNDYLYKSTVYDTDNNLLYYTLYDQTSWTYKRYDKDNNLIKSSKMMKSGK